MTTSGARGSQRLRAWWVGAGSFLLFLFVVMALPSLVLGLGWPSGQAGNLLFFGPQYVFPFGFTFVSHDRLPLGFLLDVLAWVVIALGFGLLTRRLRAWLTACVGIATILAATIVFHVIIAVFGWTFLVDGP
jgi:hypothetical protein